MKGKVKWYNKEKGYGFITNIEGDDHFFNADSVRGTSFPEADDIVKFQSVLSSKGAMFALVVENAAGPRIAI